ncbi:MAG: DUF362 domain-containing protein [Candidatus Eisenbacteria bacterium]
MKIQSRREFLKQAAAVGGTIVLSPHRVFAGEKVGAAPPDMCIARWAGDPVVGAGVNAMAAALAKRAIEDLGGMGRFVNKGDVVWIKPNIGWNRAPELAATTNPEIVATLVRLSLEVGARKVKVGDNTCHDARQSYRSSGIEAAAKEAGAEVVFLDESRFRDVKIGGRVLDQWPLYPEIIESDLLINVPVAKHHGLSRATLAMKNYMGIIGGNRGAWHQDLPGCLCDITAFVKPRLCVLDCVRVLTGHGPQGGNPSDVKRLDTVAAGIDIVAVDAFGAELLGHDPAHIGTVKAAHAAGLGEIAYRELSLSEAAVS